MNIFEFATRNKLRFKSSRGDLTTEQLWDVPITDTRSDNKFDLDSIAKLAKRELDSSSEESFVAPISDANVELATKLEVVKHIIKVKLDERDAAKDAVQRRKQKEQLIDVLAQKEAEALSKLSPSQLRAKIAELE